MKTLISKLTLISCLLGISYSTYALKPGEQLPPPSPFVSVTKGFELTPLVINLGLDGKVNYIEAKGCPGCDKLRFTVNSSTRLRVGGTAFSIDDIYLFNNQPADIVYDPDSLVLLEVSFHVMEEES